MGASSVSLQNNMCSQSHKPSHHFPRSGRVLKRRIIFTKSFKYLPTNSVQRWHANPSSLIENSNTGPSVCHSASYSFDLSHRISVLFDAWFFIITMAHHYFPLIIVLGTFETVQKSCRWGTTHTHTHTHFFLLGGEKKMCPTDIMSVFSCN